MLAATARSRHERRAQLLEVAVRVLAERGPEGLQTRTMTAELGVSTQAVYTLFGGMPGLFEALVADGFDRLVEHVESIALTDDPVADFFAQGIGYGAWALANAQLYRLMFGLTGGRLRFLSGLEETMSANLATVPEGQAALDVMIASLARVQHAGRIGAGDLDIVAGQWLSATHGFLLLHIAGAFGQYGDGFEVARPLAVNLMVGLGDDRDAAERAFATALVRLGA